MSYKSPIEVITEEVMLQMEDYIVKAVQKCGINVNKTELQRALMYDRKQYTQGFEDGRKYEQEERGHAHWELSPFDGNWTCSKCGNKPYHNSMENMNYCPNCGAKMDEDKPTFRKLRMVEQTDKAIVLKKENTDDEVTE